MGRLTFNLSQQHGGLWGETIDHEVSTPRETQGWGFNTKKGLGKEEIRREKKKKE